MKEQLGSKMRETLSALMDDEASELELHRVMREAGEDESLNQTWSRYHLAASAMRKELPLDFVDSSAELRSAISMALVNEPVPKRNGYLPQVFGRAAIAASVAVLAIIGVQQYQVFEPTASAPLIAQAETQGPIQQRTGGAEPTGPQFQLPSGFEVPAAKSQKASTVSYVQRKDYSRATLVDSPAGANKLAMDRQIKVYMERLMSQQAERRYRPANTIFLPATRSLHTGSE